MIKDYLNVPVAILHYGLINRKLHDIEIWLYLKFNTGGYFKISRRIKLQIMNFFSINSSATFNKYFNWLVKKKFITFNRNSKNYRLSGMSRIANKTKNRCYLGAIMYRDDLNYLKEFAFSAICSNLINQGQRKANRADTLIGSVRKGRRLSGLVYFPISNGQIAKAIKKSIPFVSKLKKNTYQHGYIKVKKNFSPLDKKINGTQIKYDLNERKLIKKYNEELGPRIRIHKGALSVQEIDSIASRTHLRVIRSLKRLHKSKKLAIKH